MFFCFLFVPKNKLRFEVKIFLINKVFIGWEHIILFKSGRSALRRLLEGLQEYDKRYCKIYLPDYICNVVYDASEKAGFIIKPYHIKNNFEPNWDELIDNIRNEFFPVVVLASFFGAVNCNQSIINKLVGANKDVFIIADECQNLTMNSNVGHHEKMAVLFSFNKKTLPGLMGGGICLNEYLIDYIKKGKLKIKDSVLLNGRLSYHFIKEIIGAAFLNKEKREFKTCDSRELYDYSYPSNVVYDYNPNDIAKLSLSRAHVELKNLNKINRILFENFKLLKENFPESLFYDPHSLIPYIAYIPIERNYIEIDSFKCLPIKYPYAKHNEPRYTVRKVYCVMNNIPVSWKLEI